MLRSRCVLISVKIYARRKFDEALPKEKRQDSLAAAGECYCTRLFQLEQSLMNLTPEERYNITSGWNWRNQFWTLFGMGK